MTDNRWSPRHPSWSAMLVAAIVAATTVVRVNAHDFWIAPSTYRPNAGSLVGLRLLVGQAPLGDPVPREAAAIERFVVTTGDAATLVPGRDGGDPAGILRVSAP